MNNNFKRVKEVVNSAITNYQEFIEELSKVQPKPKKEKKIGKIREFLFKKIL